MGGTGVTPGLRPVGPRGAGPHRVVRGRARLGGFLVGLGARRAPADPAPAAEPLWARPAPGAAPCEHRSIVRWAGRGGAGAEGSGGPGKPEPGLGWGVRSSGLLG